MATCDISMKTHQNFNQALSTTTNLSKKFERSCENRWRQPWQQRQYELELEIIANELELHDERIKSYDLQFGLDFARLEIDIYENFERQCHKSRQDLKDAINCTDKYSKYAMNSKMVETSEVQGKITHIGNNLVSGANNICNDELRSDSIFINTNSDNIKNQKYFNLNQTNNNSIKFDNNNKNTIETKSTDRFYAKLNNNRLNENIINNIEKNDGMSRAFMDENHENINKVEKDTHTNNCFDNTYYNTVFYSHLIERAIEKLVANNSENVIDSYDSALATSVAKKLNDSKFGSDYTFVSVKNCDICNKNQNKAIRNNHYNSNNVIKMENKCNYSSLKSGQDKISFNNSNGTTENKSKECNNKQSGRKILTCEKNLQLSQCNTNCFLLIINEEKEIGYISTDRIDTTNSKE